MIDGITINTSIANKEEWSILTGVDLSASTDISTGEIKVKKRKGLSNYVLKKSFFNNHMI
jgi:hypothetical protein